MMILIIITKISELSFVYHGKKAEQDFASKQKIFNLDTFYLIYKACYADDIGFLICCRNDNFLKSLVLSVDHFWDVCSI